MDAGERWVMKLLKIAFAALGFFGAPFLFSHKAKAVEPQEILSGVKEVKVGVCNLTADGVMAESVKETVHEKDCAIGIHPDRPTKRYAVTYDKNDNIESIIEGDKDTDTQTVIWRRAVGQPIREVP